MADMSEIKPRFRREMAGVNTWLLVISARCACALHTFAINGISRTGDTLYAFVHALPFFFGLLYRRSLPAFLLGGFVFSSVLREVGGKTRFHFSLRRVAFAFLHMDSAYMEGGRVFRFVSARRGSALRPYVYSLRKPPYFEDIVNFHYSRLYMGGVFIISELCAVFNQLIFAVLY